MRFVLFDVLLERHVTDSLERALLARGHEVFATGAVLHGQRPPEHDDERRRVDRALDDVRRFAPDVLLTFRPGTVPREEVLKLRGEGVLTMTWFCDDPVLYTEVYRDVIEVYDVVLHAGFENVLRFYADRHGDTGVTMPFWAELPHRWNPAHADVDLVLLGSAAGPVRRRRGRILDRIDVRVRVHGRLESDPLNREGTWLRDPQEVADALAHARAGLNVPQIFADYAGSPLNFSQLEELGHFWIPSRTVQYAAAGLPIITVAPRGLQETFPGAIVLDDDERLTEGVREVLQDDELLGESATLSHDAHRAAFTPQARAALLEHLALERGAWQRLSLAERATLWADLVVPGGAASLPRATRPQERAAAAGAPDDTAQEQPHGPLPVDRQRETLRRTPIQATHSLRILHLGAEDEDRTGTIGALRRALTALGHTVLHVDTARTRDHERDGVLEFSEAVYVRLDGIEPILGRFAPQVIVCNDSALAFAPDDARAVSERGVLLLGVTLGDPAAFPSVRPHAALFDYHTTNARSALPLYAEAGITNTLWMPFAADRALLADGAPPAADLAADVVTLSDADAVGERQAMLAALAAAVDVRALGRGWSVEHPAPVAKGRGLQAARAGRVHVSFAHTRAGDRVVGPDLFESLAAGVAVCAERSDELAELFVEGSEIAMFDGEDELMATVRGLLEDPGRRELMRREGFARVAHQHLYEHRWLELFRRIEEDLDADEGIVSRERAAQLRDGLRNSEPPRRFVLSGYYGAGNVGDDLMLEAITEGIRSRARGPVEFAVAAQHPDGVEERDGLAAFSRWDLDRADEEARRSSAVILGGGGLLHDYTFEQGAGVAGLFSGSRVSVTGLGVLPLMARIHRRPFHAFGLGVGPLSEPGAQDVVRFLSEQAASITVRDAASRALLEAVPGWTAPVRTAPDPVYSLELPAGAPPAEVREARVGWPLLVVSVRAWPAAERLGTYEAIAAALGEIAERHGVALVGVAAQGGDHADERVVREVFAMVDPAAPKLVVPWSADPAVLLGVLENASAVLSMRLHTSLLAHRLGRPAVGLAYDPKVQHHFDELGLGGRCAPLDVGAGGLAERLDRVLALDGRLDAGTRERVEEAEAAARASLDELTAGLAGAPAAAMPPDGRVLLRTAPTREPVGVT